MNVLVLAYLGDVLYEEYVRKFFVLKGIPSVLELQKKVVPIVQAKGQAKFLAKFLEEDFFTEEELSVIHRARNAKNHGSPKNCDILTYKYATAMEAVIGYLDLVGNKSRIDEIMEKILEEYK